jgi:hypothetical protein
MIFWIYIILWSEISQFIRSEHYIDYLSTKMIQKKYMYYKVVDLVDIITIFYKYYLHPSFYKTVMIFLNVFGVTTGSICGFSTSELHPAFLLQCWKLPECSNLPLDQCYFCKNLTRRDYFCKIIKSIGFPGGWALASLLCLQGLCSRSPHLAHRIVCPVGPGCRFVQYGWK